MQTPDNQNDRVWLTPLLNRIANVAGENAAIALGRARAGERIYIPETHDGGSLACRARRP